MGNSIEEVIDLARKINLDVNSDNLQELLVSINRELTIDELIEMHEQDIEEDESLGSVQSEDRMMVGNLAEVLYLAKIKSYTRSVYFQVRGCIRALLLSCELIWLRNQNEAQRLEHRDKTVKIEPSHEGKKWRVSSTVL
ncbi:hypothetical protein TNCV_333551 [Trichonephila clavipes]|nr:hypothetical protein TNCV_333551 [Trichonephila clavipes]